MPGFNQRGPRNEGPMTGWGRGICTGNGDPGYGSAGRRGRGMGMGIRCRGGRGGYGGGGRGMGFGASQAGYAPAGNVDIKEDLRARADMLEAELSAIKNQLNDLPGSED